MPLTLYQAGSCLLCDEMGLYLQRSFDHATIQQKVRLGKNMFAMQMISITPEITRDSTIRLCDIEKKKST